MRTSKASSDTGLHDCVEAKLRALGSPELDRVTIIVFEGNVTLEGTVTTYHLKQRAQHATAAVEGIRTLSNHLDVMSVSVVNTR